MLYILFWIEKICPSEFPFSNKYSLKNIDFGILGAVMLSYLYIYYVCQLFISHCTLYLLPNSCFIIRRNNTIKIE